MVANKKGSVSSEACQDTHSEACSKGRVVDGYSLSLFGFRYGQWWSDALAPLVGILGSLDVWLLTMQLVSPWMCLVQGK
jgi:hypothetical protein